MILTYHGGLCVKATAGDTTVVFGPISKETKGLKPTNFGADVAFIPANHPDMNGADEASRGDRQAFKIAGPGEYEIKEIAAWGFPSKTGYGGLERINTVYYIVFDGLNVLYLGAHAESQIPKEAQEHDSPDVVIVPVGAEGTLSPSEAWKLAVSLEAKIVIPVGYDPSALKQFLKEAGADDVKGEEKLTIKKKDVQGKENEVFILTA